LVKRYGNDKSSFPWLDPGKAEALEHSLSVLMDVVERYDVDGVHIDDYFYPYPMDDQPFPDNPASVQGFNQNESLYADAKLWLNEGWCDYDSPQLYWSISAKQRNFPALLASFTSA